jgi:hypothetical protein
LLWLVLLSVSTAKSEVRQAGVEDWMTAVAVGVVRVSEPGNRLCSFDGRCEELEAGLKETVRVSFA